MLFQVMSSKYTLFMSHAWKEDEKGRDVHGRIVTLVSILRSLGWSIWLDQDHMKAGCNVDATIARGILDSKVVCVCLTRAYLEKVESSAIRTSGGRDNCEKEWTCSTATGKMIIPLIMDESMLDTSTWPAGVISMHLGRSFYIDGVSDDLHHVASNVANMLTLLGCRAGITKQSKFERIRSTFSVVHALQYPSSTCHHTRKKLASNRRLIKI